MKLVAAHNLLNVKNLAIKPDDKQVHTFPDVMKHPGLINKGTRFSIGESEKADELQDADKIKILWLVKGHPRSVQAVAASDKAVERIDREVKEDIRKFNEDSKPQPDQATLIAAAVAKALAEAGVIKAKA